MRIPLFGFGMASKSPTVTAKRLVNLYAETRPAGEKSTIVAYGTPGLNTFVDFGDTPIRGGIEHESSERAYVVHRGTFYEINNAGVTTARGAIATTTGRVSLAHNGVQIMIVDGDEGYIFNTDTLAFANITDPDFFDSPVTVCCLGRRFVVSFVNSQVFQWSEIEDGLAWSGDFASAEAGYDPIIAVLEQNGGLHILGNNTTEFHGLSGVDDPAFVPLPGTATEWGLAARWSVAKYAESYACLMKNRTGQVMIAQMVGYQVKKLSTIDLDSEINDKTIYPTTGDASGYGYMLGGHPMYVISFPTAGRTWLFDGSSGLWSPLKSFAIARHRAEFSFGLFGRTLVADYEVGRLYELTQEALTDNGAQIESEIVGETIANEYEGQISIDCLRLDMETGVGTTSGAGSNPQVSLSISRDNGKTWGPEMFKPMGRIGEYRTRVEWRRLGSPRFFTPKIRISDPVKRCIVNACLNPED